MPKRKPEEPIQVNQIIGHTPPLFGIVPVAQLPFWAGAIVLAWIICGITGLGVGLEFFILAFCLVAVTTFVLGSRPSDFLDKLRPPPGKDFINGHTPYLSPIEEWRPEALQRRFAGKLMIRSPRHQVIAGDKRFSYMPLQNFCDALCIVEVVTPNGPVAGVLLQRSKSLEVHWYWDTQPIHDYLTPMEASKRSEALEIGLKKMLETERLMLSLSNFSEYQSRIDQIDQVVAKCNSPVVQVITSNAKQKVKSLSRSGHRRCYRQVARGTWSTVGNHKASQKDWTDTLLGLLGKISGSISRSKRASDIAFYTSLLQRAYNEGYIPWELCLKAMGLEPRPMSAESLYAYLCSHFFDGPTGAAPQVLRLSITGAELELSEDKKSEKHLMTCLLDGMGIHDAVVEHHGVTNRITLPGREEDRREVAAMVLDERPSTFPDTWGMLKWMSDILASDHGYNCVAHVELIAQKPFIIRQALTQSQRAAYAAQERAAETGLGRDVGAELNAKDIAAAQEKLYVNKVPVAAAPLFLVYRPSPAALTHSCNLLMNTFGANSAKRDTTNTWKYFLQAVSLINEPLLDVTMGNRRLILESDTVQGLMPLTVTQDLHPDGVEFISAYGNKPIHLDLFHGGTANTMLILGTRGSGKTGLAWEKILHYAAKNIPVVGIDINTDGVASYQDGIELLGPEVGGYLDIGEKGSNFVEPPNVYLFGDKQVRRERYEIWQELVIASLYSLAVGNCQPELAERIEKLIQISFRKFLEDDTISDRYRSALKGGYRSTEWQRIPILSDWLKFCRRERLNLDVFTQMDEAAVGQIQTQFAAILGSRVGKAINQPTSFNPHAKIRFFSINSSASRQESLILVLSADMLSTRMSMENDFSLFVGDEVSVMLKYPGVDKLYAKKAALGRKGGQGMILVTQDFSSLLNCPSSNMIIDNLRYRVIGALEETGAQTLSRSLEYPADVLRNNCGGFMRCSAPDQHRYWLIEEGGRFRETYHFPSDMGLSSIANNPLELQARRRFFKAYPGDLQGRLMALNEFSGSYIRALNNHTPLDELSPNVNPQKFA
jgi:hypothetical protein